jgi:hypothetical protein
MPLHVAYTNSAASAFERRLWPSEEDTFGVPRLARLSTHDAARADAPRRPLELHAWRQDGAVDAGRRLSECAGGGVPTQHAHAHAAQQAAATPSALLAQLTGLLSSGAGADCALAAACGTVALPCHRWLLAARSPVLAVALRSAAWAAADAPPLPLAGVDAPTLRRFVAFMYTEDASAALPRDASWADALALMRAADAYDVAALRCVCEAALAARLRVSNAAEALAVAERCRAPALRDAAAAFLRAHLQEVAATPGWARLVAEMPHLLRACLSEQQRRGGKRCREDNADDSDARMSAAADVMA